IIGMFAAPPILFLELRKRSRARKGTASNEVTGVTESAEAVVVPSSALFKLIGGIALVCEIFGAVFWSSAIAMRDSDVANGALVFLGLFGVVVLACYAANRNIRLFVQQDIVGADADVIVVGAGLAGLVATAELADAGRRVILLEQEPEPWLGGQAFWSFGGLFLVNSPEQRRLGVHDSVERALGDWLRTAG